MVLFGYEFPLNSFWSILLYCILVLLVAWVIARIVRFLLIAYINRKGAKEQYSITRLKFIKNSVTFFIGLLTFSFIIYTVPQFKSRATLIFSGAGILAAIIGFAAQAAVSNLIAGAFIVIFRPFRVGDFIKLDDSRVGIVNDITLRHTVINTFDNKRLIIPNSVISTESIFNHSIDDEYVLTFNNFIIGLNADIDAAIAIIREEALKLDYIIDNRTPEQLEQGEEQIRIRVKDMNEIGVYLRAFVWVAEPWDEFRVKSDLLQAVHRRFKDEGIDLPVPMRRIVN
ncbi:MAG: mechanosensitive ion channel family protein [Flavobacteriaceae bacterium]|nr:mechanosensitive ion channel family protein [Flavobacteriaceae bacterium]